MKKNLKILLMSLIMMFTLFSCNLLENKTLHVPKSYVQKELDKKFPITKNYYLAKLTLKNPVVNFVDDKIFIEADYTASLLTGKNSGKIYVNSNVKYDIIKEELYLVDLNIEKIVDENGREIGDNPEVNVIKSLLSSYIEKNPVYNYGKEYEEKNKDRTKKKIKIKNMYIKKGKLYIQT